MTLALTPWSARAHSGGVFHAFLSNAVTVDGVLSPGEWSDASTKDFSMCGGTLPGRMYVKNDQTHLYIAVVVHNVGWNFGVPGTGNDFLNLLFDNNHNGITETGENHWAVRGADSLTVDAFNPNGVPHHSSQDSFSGGTEDLVAAVTHTNPVENGIGTYTVEYRGLLDSLDDLHDFSLAPGATVGVSFVLADAAPVCDSVWPSNNASQFADIVIVPEGDRDVDGVLDVVDNCPGAANPDQADADGDGTGDVCDDDDDNDAVADAVDNCPLTPNADQNDTDADGLGNACDADDDDDDVADEADNCPLTPNADQNDTDADGLGNACDADDDNDGVADGNDNCPVTAAGNVIDASGCSIADLCPCTGSWKNHGAYVSCVARASAAFQGAGLITPAQKGAITSQAAQSSCGGQ